MFLSIFNEFSLIEELRNILTIKYQIFRQIIKKLLEINPNKFPKFAYAWIELVSYKKFFPFLKDKIEDVLPILSEVVNFVLDVGKRNTIYYANSFDELKKLLYRFIYMISHDFPEIIYNNLYSILNIIPQEMVQLKNIILNDYQIKDTKEEETILSHYYEYCTQPSNVKTFIIEDSIKDSIKDLKIEYLNEIFTMTDNINASK